MVPPLVGHAANYRITKGSENGKSTATSKRCSIHIVKNGICCGSWQKIALLPISGIGVYDDDHNDDRPEDEDFAFHSLLPPTPPCVIRR